MKLKIIGLIILVPVVLILAYLSMELVRTYFLSPILHTTRIIKIIYDGFPKEICWGISLVFLAIIAIRSLMNYFQPQTAYKIPVNESPQSRAKTWSNWVVLSRRGNYSKWLLARHLTELFLEVLATQEKQSSEIVKSRIMNGEYNIPPEIEAYLQAGLSAQSFQQYTQYLGNRLLLRWINSYPIFRQIRNSVLPSPLNLDPAIMVEFIENQYTKGGSL